jgi:NADPH:quinone reductase-like Zn-dependent oxidoreductase
MAGTRNRSWKLSAFGAEGLALENAPLPEPGPYDLLVRVRAVSLNYKDKLIVDGVLMPDLAFPYVPASDAVGEVVAVGREVSRFKAGDRVLGQVIADWPDGDAPEVLHKKTLGMTLPGVLSDYVVFGEDAAVAAPPSLGDAEASTLPIAALTAWTALVEMTKSVAGETVLIEGTGGVSLFALQFAVAFGLKAIVTSSNDDKLARARELGAWKTINYRSQPDWDEAVRAATGGRGVDHVLEVVGGDNMRRSVNALAADGRISLIGILADTGFTLSIVPFIRNRLTIQGISIGSRRAFERMNEAIEALAVKPVIDTIYPFEEVPRAFEHLGRGPFGKVVVALT